MPRTSPLKKHVFPQFYACYLLRSIRTPRSTATYIGSTPNPPRRIRQHNGEITQGAWKTKHNRPWVMQMIVHGFPSRLAALQFEWAWQHPHISRHLRFPDGNPIFSRQRGSQNIKKNVLIARTMISHHPYNLWPLHVKLFTEEAHKAWITAVADLPLPEGLSYTKELEGVDGRSGKTSSGRQGPIDVTDSAFMAQYLPKHDLIPKSPTCSICFGKLNDYPSNSLNTALCTSIGCTAVSHLQCLAAHFLSQRQSISAILPRGGTCKSCNSYTLWGDVIRGSYRRHTGGMVDEQEDDDPDDESEQEDAPILRQTPKTRAKGLKSKAVRPSDTEGEAYDLEGIRSDSSSDDMHIPLERTKQPVAMGKGKSCAPQTSQTEEFFDLDGIGSDSQPAPQRAQGPKKPRRAANARVVAATFDSETGGEVFDLDGIDSDSSNSIQKEPGRAGLARTLSQLSISSPGSTVFVISD